jgi:CDP-diacylglycerol pyrophosphatase
MLVLLSMFSTTTVYASGTRDALWDIITHCLDSSIPDYCLQCRSPKTDTPCAVDKDCKDTLSVWDESQDFVLIRDRKMCGCPEGFVHSLVIPKKKVSGMEDPQRPDGIWLFAWNNAKKLIDDEKAITLVVNPSRQRSQDQLHVHVLRLKTDARRHFSEPFTSHIQNLNDVWQAARQNATAASLDDYGVLVAADPAEGFVVLIDGNSPEWLYTQPNCR